MLCRLALAFKSSSESFFSAAVLRAESMSVKHTKAVACPDCLSAPALPPSLQLALHTSAFYHRDVFIWKLITGFILICVWWGAEKRKCSLLILPEFQNGNYVRLLHLHPCRQRPWGGGAVKAARMAMKPESPLTTRDIVALPETVPALSSWFSPGSSSS